MLVGFAVIVVAVLTMVVIPLRLPGVCSAALAPDQALEIAASNPDPLTIGAGIDAQVLYFFGFESSGLTPWAFHESLLHSRRPAGSIGPWLV
jgi:hypothetical protein